MNKLKERANLKEWAKTFTCGLLPPASFFLSQAEHIEYFKSVSEEQLQKALDLLERTHETKEKFLNLLPAWLEGRIECIIKLEELANDIEMHHRNISIAQLPTSAFGIAGGILTITGLALSPVTFGTSLILTITGATVGGAVAVTGMATSANDIGIQVDCLKKAKACTQSHKDATTEMVETMNELLENFTVGIGYSVIKTIPIAAKPLYLLRKSGIAAAILVHLLGVL